MPEFKEYRKLRPEECELTIWGVPKSLKIRFKAACAGRNQSMKAVILESIQKYLKKWE